MEKDFTLEKNAFEFYAPIERIEKGKSHKDGAIIDVLVYGVISTMKKDAEGDEIPQDLMDYSFLEKKGRIKYGHEKSLKQRIGVPQGVIGLGDKTYMVGRVFAKAGTPQYETASEFVGDYENMEEWNKHHPEEKREFYFSIEGGLAKHKITNQILKGIATDVALTDRPKNDTTYAKIAKAFMAGDATSLSEMTGGQAGRKESLNGSHKHLTIGVNSMNFKDKKECYDYLIEKGIPENEAEKVSNEWDEAHKQSETRNESFKKSLDGLDTSSTEIKSFIDAKPSETFETFEKGYNQSVLPVTGADTVDGIPFMKAIGTGLLANHEAIEKGFKEMAKFIGGQNDALKSVVEMNKDLAETNAQLIGMVKDLEIDNYLLRKDIDSFESKVITDNTKLEDIKPEDANTEKIEKGERTKEDGSLDNALYPVRKVKDALCEAAINVEEQAIEKGLTDSVSLYELTRDVNSLNRNIVTKYIDPVLFPEK